VNKNKQEENPADRKTPAGVWVQYRGWREPFFPKEFESKMVVCPRYDYRLPLSGYKRVDFLTGEGSWYERAADLPAVDVSSFTDKKPYAQRLAEAEKKAGVNNAVEVFSAATAFGFAGGLRGGAVGEEAAGTFPRGAARRRGVRGIVAGMLKVLMPEDASGSSDKGGY
jgi:acetyl-CoA carboxylase carboxyl transferase subunit beta